MKYVNPEIKINMFECEAVATQASTITPDEYVTGLQDVQNKTKISLNQLTKVTKFVY